MTRAGEASGSRPYDPESSVTTGYSAAEALPGSAAHAEQELRQNVERLCRIRELKEKQATLLRDIAELEGSQPSSSRRRRRSRSSSASSEGKDLQTRSITTFSASFSFQRRDLWLSDLKRAFKGAPKHFRKPEKRILFALDHMNEDCRQRWDQFINESGEEHEQTAADWSKFEEWNLSLLKDSRNRLPYLRKQLEAATQGELQSPWEFHHYLSSLEDKFGKLAEEERAYQFYAKLRPELRGHMDLYANPLPETRLLMVSTAQNFWETIFKKNNKRRATDQAGPSRESTKKSRRHQRSEKDSSAAPSSRPAKQESSSSAAKGKNPVTTSGRILRCYHCQSDTHLRDKCPELANTEKSSGTAKAQAIDADSSKDRKGKEKAAK